MTELIYFGHPSIYFFTKPLFYFYFSFDAILYPFCISCPPFHILSFHLATSFSQLRRYFPNLPPTKRDKTNVRVTWSRGSTITLLQLCNLSLWCSEREIIIHAYPRTLSDHTMLLIQLEWDVVSQDNGHVLPFAFINIHTLLKKE